MVFELARKIIEMNDKLRARARASFRQAADRAHAQRAVPGAGGGKARRLMGCRRSLAILDEVGQVEGPTDKFIGAITTAQGAYEHPLLIAISTQAPSDNDLFSVWLDTQQTAKDPRIVSHVYSAPEECALDERTGWYAANPALGVFRSLADVEKQASLAMLMPANEPEFRNLILNQRVESASPFVARSVWLANDADPGPLAGRKVWGGLDLSEVADLTALVLVDDTGGVHPTFWLPEEGLREKARADHVPYDLWQRDGLLQTTPGKAIEYEFVAEYLRGRVDRCDVQLIGSTHNMRHLKPWLHKAGFSDAEMEKFIECGQGYQSMTPAARTEVRLLRNSLRHGGHPIQHV